MLFKMAVALLMALLPALLIWTLVGRPASDVKELGGMTVSVTDGHGLLARKAEITPVGVMPFSMGATVVLTFKEPITLDMITHEPRVYRIQGVTVQFSDERRLLETERTVNGNVLTLRLIAPSSNFPPFRDQRVKRE